MQRTWAFPDAKRKFSSATCTVTSKWEAAADDRDENLSVVSPSRFAAKVNAA